MRETFPISGGGGPVIGFWAAATTLVPSAGMAGAGSPNKLITGYLGLGVP